MSRDRQGRALEPMDPDVELITRYLVNALTPAESRAFDRRLAVDPAFRLKAIPRIILWELPGDSASSPLDEAYAAVMAARGGSKAVVVKAPTPKPLPTTRSVHSAATPRWRAWTPAVVWRAVYPIVAKLFVGFIALAILSKAYDVAHEPAPAPAFAPAASTSPSAQLGVPLDSAAHQFTLPIGLTVVLEPGSTLTYEKFMGQNYNARLKGGGGRGGKAKAAMSIEVAAPMQAIDVYTGTGRMTLREGRYEVRVDTTGRGETQLTVIAGHAVAYGFRSRVPRLVNPGERALIHVGERPDIVP